MSLSLCWLQLVSVLNKVSCVAVVLLVLRIAKIYFQPFDVF